MGPLTLNCTRQWHLNAGGSVNIELYKLYNLYNCTCPSFSLPSSTLPEPPPPPLPSSTLPEPPPPLPSSTLPGPQSFTEEYFLNYFLEFQFYFHSIQHQHQFKSEQPSDAVYGVQPDQHLNEDYYAGYNLSNGGITIPTSTSYQPEHEESSVLMVQLNSQPSTNGGVQSRKSYPEDQLAPSQQQHVLVPTFTQQQINLPPKERFVMPDVVVELQQRLMEKMEKVYELSKKSNEVGEILLRTHNGSSDIVINSFQLLFYLFIGAYSFNQPSSPTFRRPHVSNAQFQGRDVCHCP